MSLERFYYISQIIASFAVLASLIYLALQTRQTARNQKALMNQGVINRGSDAVHWMSEPRLLELTARIYSGETEFTLQELLHLRFVLRIQLLNCQDTYVQHKAGLIDQITMDNNLGVMKIFLSQPVYRALWTDNRANYSHELVAFVDGLIAQTPLAKPIDRVARFKTDLAAVMG